jgi:hypothetical protein
MSSFATPEISKEQEHKSAQLPASSADDFQVRFFGASETVTRQQPWRNHIKVKEHHYIHIVNENLRLWGKHVAAHSWSVPTSYSGCHQYLANNYKMFFTVAWINRGKIVLKL